MRGAAEMFFKSCVELAGRIAMFDSNGFEWIGCCFQSVGCPLHFLPHNIVMDSMAKRQLKAALKLVFVNAEYRTKFLYKDRFA